MESCRQETLLFHEIEAVIATKERANGIMNIYDFQKTPGHLQCTISDWQRSDHGHFKAILGVPNAVRY
jgi:hypothetical protein